MPAYVKLDLVTGDVYTQTRVRFMETQYERAIEMATTGLHELFLPASAFRPNVGFEPSEVLQTLSTAGLPHVAAWGFSATADQYINTTFALPKKYNNGTLTFKAYWLNRAGGAGVVRWRGFGKANGDDEAIGQGFSSVQDVDDTALTADRLAISPASPAITLDGTPAVGDIVNFFAGRQGSHGSDTYASVAYLIGVKLFLTTDKSTDA